MKIYSRLSILFLAAFSMACARMDRLVEKIPAQANTQGLGPGQIYSEKTKTFQVPNGSTQVDFVVVLDNSGSMYENIPHIADRMDNFIYQLEFTPIQWQMCLVTTESSNSYPWAFGKDQKADPSQIVMDHLTPDKNYIFRETLQQISNSKPGKGDERGIAIANKHYSNPENKACFRNQAQKVYIFISDEDEASVGFNPTDAGYNAEIKILNELDAPDNLLKLIRQREGQNTSITANSIIVQKGDSTCKTYEDSHGSISHYGLFYQRLTEMTNGMSISLCKQDYSEDLLKLPVLQQISKQSLTIPLNCTVSSRHSVKVMTTRNYEVPSLVKNNNVELQVPAVPGETLRIEYVCIQ